MPILQWINWNLKFGLRFVTPPKSAKPMDIFEKKRVEQPLGQRPNEKAISRAEMQ